MDKKSFFILYPRVAEEDAMRFTQELNYRLAINYKLWSYAEVEDEVDYFERFIQPEIERAAIILALVAKDTQEDYLLKSGCKYASDLGEQQIVPIKIGDGKVKDKNWSFRTSIIDFSKEEERANLITNLYGWLGLRKTGDIYGTKVTLSSDENASVIRSDEMIGNVSSVKKLSFNLAKGNGAFIVQSGDHWNKYVYHIADNNGQVDFNATLKDNIMLSNTSQGRLVFDPLVDPKPKWDVTDRSDFMLSASSEDAKKKQAIYDSYERCYKATIRPYPEYDTKDFRNRGYLFAVFGGLAGLLLYIGIFAGEGGVALAGPLIFLLFLFLRGRRKKQLRRWNRRKKRKMEERIDKFNQNRWSLCVNDMNALLASHGLANMSLTNLGTPSRFVPTSVDTLGYEAKAETYYNKGDYGEALRWYRIAAEEGSEDAQTALGNMLLHGEGTSVDYVQAAEWFRFASVQGEQHAQFNLGNMYYIGQGVRQDRVVALKWYLKAAEQGHADAQENAALLLSSGKGGVRRDVKQAAKWFYKAGMNGLAVSQYHYGLCLESGRGVKRDYSEAALWYEKAAEAGVIEAMLKLSNLYRRGRGVAMDQGEAQKWRQLAEENRLKTK